MGTEPESKKGVVAVAMSGGVDSSIAAALLKEEDREVFGLTMNLFSLPPEFCASEKLKSCCGWKAREDAHRVAVALGIPHYVVDLRPEFERNVIADFCREYGRGRTPNPCVRCNQFIKFGLLLDRARRLGAEFVATGHYASIEPAREKGRRRLLKGADPEKDQSYFLFNLTQDLLATTIFPVGGKTKTEVRGLAARLGLPVASKPESQEICFVPDKNYPGFLKDRCPEAFRRGPITDLEGRNIGEHHGIAYFTVGQRKGMGIAAAHPLYVVAIDPERNTVIAGRNEDLYRRRLLASHLNWIAFDKPAAPFQAKAKIRYKHTEAKCLIEPRDPDQVLVEFERPQRAVTPGQAVVFYDGEEVLGGGIIDRALEV